MKTWSRLASAAVSTLDRILHRLEKMSGKSRSEVSYFALHEPNPRVVGILAQRAKVPWEKIRFVSRTAGNLGILPNGVYRHVQPSGHDFSRADRARWRSASAPEVSLAVSVARQTSAAKAALQSPTFGMAPAPAR